MARLGVNVDHVATLRQARGGQEPDPVRAAMLAEMGGADGIVVHLREDRRHIQDRDLRLLREIVQTKLDLEMSATDAMARVAMEFKPHLVTFVPERRQELTTEGGLDVEGNRDRFKEMITLLHQGGIAVSLFIEPDLDQIKAARRVEADCIELHTGRYANARAKRKRPPGRNRRALLSGLPVIWEERSGALPPGALGGRPRRIRVRAGRPGARSSESRRD